MSEVLEEEPLVSRLEVDSAPDCSPFSSDVSDSGAKDSVCFAANSVLDCEHENQRLPSQACSSPYAFPGSYRDSFSQGESDETFYTKRRGISKHEIAVYGVETSFPEVHSNNISVCGDNLNLTMWKGENDSHIKHVGEDVESERM